MAHEQMTRAEGEMLNGLAHVVRRIDTSAKIRYLTGAEITGVLDKEAGYYRRMAEADCIRSVSSGSLKAHDANA